MNKRPVLDKYLNEKTFRSYYYLKSELVDFCRENNLPILGGKIALTDRVAYFLSTGKVLDNIKSKSRYTNTDNISEDTIIGDNIVYSEKLRKFFEERIGKSFSFKVPFQRWLKSNPDKTYGDAIEAYQRIIKEKKKVSIDKQFEYNTYIRDFFNDNKGKTLEDAIKCWKYKKSLPGHNRYEKEDLFILNKNKKY